jgi:hypothetical protein
VGLDSLFLWVKCADQGLSALEVDVGGSIPVLAFRPREGTLNLRTSTELLLAVTGCPSGDSVSVILGSFVVNDTQGGDLYLEPSENWNYLVAVSCDSSQYSYPYIPRAVGFASDGGDPDTTGYAWGCGTFPERADPQAPVGTWSWSTAYGAPPNGLGVLGTNPSVDAIRKVGDHALYVAGSFEVVGPELLVVPRFARFNFTTGQVPGYWDWAPSWGTPTFPSSGSYLAVDFYGSRIALGGNTQPGLFRYFDGAEWFDGTPVPSSSGRLPNPEILGIEYWSVNDKFLVVGDFGYANGGGGPLSDRFNCLAQLNPGEFSLDFEPFGYPAVGDTGWWIQADDGQRVLAVAEIERPGEQLDGYLFVGGDFEDVSFDTPSGGGIRTDVAHIFWLDDEGGFTAASLPGPVHEFELRPTKTHLYMAGEFGRSSPDNELQLGQVWYVALDEGPPPLFGILPGGGGPYKFGAQSWAVIHDLFFQNDYLYAVGDFDRVLTKSPGGAAFECDGFARYSMQSETWESLGDANSINGPTVVGEWMPNAVMIGGGFTQVDGSIESYHVAQHNPSEILSAAPEASDPRIAPLAMQITSANPTGGSVSVYYSVPRSGPVRLGVFDVAGRRVARVVDEVQNAGEQHVTWDGRTASGALVHPGVYFVRVETASESVASKVVVVR